MNFIPSSINTNPYLPEIVIFSVLAIAFLYILITHKSLLKFYSRPLVIRLVLLRLLIMILFGVFLHNIELVYEKPDSSSYVVPVLLDSSGSMNQKDVNDASRLASLNDEISQKDSFFKKISQKHNLIFSEFNEEVSHLDAENALLATSKNTNIDHAILEALDKNKIFDIGAIVVVTDGNDNVDEPAHRVIKHLQDLEIPLNIIGIGGDRDVKDVVLQVKNPPKELERGERGIISGEVHLNNIFKDKLKVRLWQNNTLLEEQEVSFLGEDTKSEFSFSVSSYQVGRLHYKLEVDRIDGESDYANNQAYLAIDYKDPMLFKILYLGSALNWEFKFLKQEISKTEGFLFHAFVYKDEKVAYQLGFEEENKEFPDFQKLKDYHAILFDLNLLPYLTADQINAIVSYNDRVGGGLMLIGPYVQDLKADEILKLLPVEPGTIHQYGTRRRVNISFTRAFENILQERPKFAETLYVPESHFIQHAARKKLGAFELLEEDGSYAGLIHAHYYGSGKVAWIGMDSTWRWVMDAKGGASAYRGFWSNLLQWLATGVQAPLKVWPHFETFEQNAEIQFKAEVFNHQFLPEDQAIVKVRIKRPGAQLEEELPLQVSNRYSGVYQAPFAVNEIGDYDYVLEAIIPIQGEEVSTITRRFEGKFSVLENSTEKGDNRLQTALLSDMARLTGGKYWDWKERKTIDDITISSKINKLKEIDSFNRKFLFIIPFLGLILFDIYYRRKNGLR